ncbi:hypothetical protein B0O99DRAFT_595812 [Bisporella sp. PMI_857]|nr:hypothetical protein B0O99DRAFT_595812 [Bisporella sp. PMI_857]
MAVSRSRTITLAVALATLTSNVLSSLLSSQLPDDPYHLAANYRWYLHIANIGSVFGFVGALRQHAPSIALFANYLLLDTLLSAIPRIALLSLIAPLAGTLCASPPSFRYTNTPDQQPQLSPSISQATSSQPAEVSSQLQNIAATWTPEGCQQIVQLTQITLAASVLAATVLQLAGALAVRGFARKLYREERKIEGCMEVE